MSTVIQTQFFSVLILEFKRPFPLSIKCDSPVSRDFSRVRHRQQSRQSPSFKTKCLYKETSDIVPKLLILASAFSFWGRCYQVSRTRSRNGFNYNLQEPLNRLSVFRRNIIADSIFLLTLEKLRILLLKKMVMWEVQDVSFLNSLE